MYTKYTKLRDERNLNDLNVANATGVPVTTLYDWKKRVATDSKAELSFSNIEKIARFFGVSLDYFKGV